MTGLEVDSLPSLSLSPPLPNIKVIDPEFCVHGPPGLDVGSLLSGLVLAHLYQMQRAAVAGVASNPSDGGADMLPMHAAVDVLWRTYVPEPRRPIRTPSHE